MSRRIVGVLPVVTIATLVFGLSCTKLEVPANVSARVAEEVLMRPDAIPAAWGNLVAVSSVPAYPDLVQLWFQDQQGAVRMVAFRVSTQEILNAHVVRRS
jgi:hypothetical protein